MAPNNSDSDERGRGFIDAGNDPVTLITASGGGREDRYNREFPSPEIRGSQKEKKTTLRVSNERYIVIGNLSPKRTVLLCQTS